MSKKIRYLYVIFGFLFLFYFVYSNIYLVPYNHIAFVKERVDGWDHRVYKSGYHWFWQGFIPKQIDVHLVHILVETDDLDIELKLPYAEFLKLPNFFLVKVKLQVSYSLDIHFIKKEVFNNIFSLNTIYKEIQKKIKYVIISKIQEIIINTKNISNIQNNIEFFFANQDNLKNEIIKYGVHLKKLQFLHAKVPSKDLYQEYLKNIKDFIQAYKKSGINEITKNMDLDLKKKENQLEIAKLKEMVEIVKDENKILEYIKYFYMNPKANTIILDESSYINNHHTEKKSPKELQKKIQKKENDTIFKKIKRMFTREELKQNTQKPSTSVHNVGTLEPFQKK